MGRMLEENRTSKNSVQSKKRSKGQRLGWAHKSDYEPILLRTLSANSEKLCTYTSGPFATNKLVP